VLNITNKKTDRIIYGDGKMITKTVVFKELNFENRKTKWFLEFRDSITFVTGDSGTGKTYTFDMLKALSLANAEYENISFYTINGRMTSERMLRIEKDILEERNKLIVIDHADLILSERAREFIGTDLNNQYLIFGRNPEDICCYPNQIVRLEKTQTDKTEIRFNWYMLGE
jgi:hypothetical protein